MGGLPLPYSAVLLDLLSEITLFNHIVALPESPGPLVTSERITVADIAVTGTFRQLRRAHAGGRLDLGPVL